MKTILFTLFGMLLLTSQANADVSEATCVKVDGSGYSSFPLQIDANDKATKVTASLPDSDLRPALELKTEVDAGDFYGAKIFYDDGADTFDLIISKDVSGLFAILSTSGDNDTQASFYRCGRASVLKI